MSAKIIINFHKGNINYKLYVKFNLIFTWTLCMFIKLIGQFCCFSSWYDNISHHLIQPAIGLACIVTEFKCMGLSGLYFSVVGCFSSSSKVSNPSITLKKVSFRYYFTLFNTTTCFNCPSPSGRVPLGTCSRWLHIKFY